jgi:hypothetical protein
MRLDPVLAVLSLSSTKSGISLGKNRSAIVPLPSFLLLMGLDVVSSLFMPTGCHDHHRKNKKKRAQCEVVLTAPQKKLFSLSQMDVKNKKKMFGAANNRPRKRIYFCYTECKEQEKFELSK